MSFSLYSQKEMSNKHTIGINLAQLPGLAVDFGYEYTLKPYLDITGNIGYGYNHVKGFDINEFLIPHIDSGNNGITIINQTGGFIKGGIKLNSRKSFPKRNYFFGGISLVYSYVYEQIISEYICPPFGYRGPCIPIFLKQSKHILGAGTTFGYSFKISKKFQGDFGLQVGFPIINYKSLYGYRNYIPGIGFKDSYQYWFPSLIFNLKYNI